MRGQLTHQGPAPGKQSQDSNPDLLVSRALPRITWLHCPSPGRWEEGHVQAEGTAHTKAWKQEEQVLTLRGWSVVCAGLAQWEPRRLFGIEAGEKGRD